MTYTLLFIVGLLLLGLGTIIYARPLAIWEYKFDSRFKMTFGIGITTRVWYFRVAGIIIIGIALFGSAASLGGLYKMDDYQSQILLWAQVSAWAAVVGVLVLTATVFFLVRQYRNSTKALVLQGYVSIINWLQTQEIRKARGMVFKLRLKPVEQWSADERREAEVVCSSYEMLGQIIKDLKISRKIFEGWKASVIRTWKIVSPLVKSYREERQHYHLWLNYEWLATNGFELNEEEKKLEEEWEKSELLPYSTERQ